MFIRLKAHAFYEIEEFQFMIRARIQGLPKIRYNLTSSTFLKLHMGLPEEQF